jgi:hypothetical protein
VREHVLAALGDERLTSQEVWLRLSWLPWRNVGRELSAGFRLGYLDREPSGRGAFGVSFRYWRK